MATKVKMTLMTPIQAEEVKALAVLPPAVAKIFVE